MSIVRQINKAVEICGNHSYYGCDSGCCGYKLVLYDKDGGEVYEKFYFSHPDNDDDAIDLLLEDSIFDGKEHFIKNLKREFDDLGRCY